MQNSSELFTDPVELCIVSGESGKRLNDARAGGNREELRCSVIAIDAVGQLVKDSLEE